jgi:hypothetical protein
VSTGRGPTQCPAIINSYFITTKVKAPSTAPDETSTSCNGIIRTNSLNIDQLNIKVHAASVSSIVINITKLTIPHCARSSAIPQDKFHGARITKLMKDAITDPEDQEGKSGVIHANFIFSHRVTDSV